MCFWGGVRPVRWGWRAFCGVSRISGVPVVGSDGELLGMVSEGTLWAGLRAGPGGGGRGWLPFLTDGGSRGTSLVGGIWAGLPMG